MYISTLVIDNFRCFGSGKDRLVLHLNSGLTALVGENDKGKSAIIDALRFALGTTDQEWYRLEDTDFHNEDTSNEIKITCKFDGLNTQDKRAFVEYLTYDENNANEPILYVNWTAEYTGIKHNGYQYKRIEICSGKNGDGSAIAPEARELLKAVYLRPLRDAEQALSSGRGSRLAQVMSCSEKINNCGMPYDPNKLIDDQKLSILEIGKLMNMLLESQEGIVCTQNDIDGNLSFLSLANDNLKSNIKVNSTDSTDHTRLRELLEKLDLNLDGKGKHGLGSNNLLFMACELILLAQENEGNKLLLIEEPEAHLHAQRQLRVMRFLQDQAKSKGIQIIVTTHSPNLASAISLDSLVMMHNGHAFSMANEQTMLSSSDYRFLERFLDVTKANLFFARGVMIVEGDAENILIPTLAKLIGRDLTEHGVSIVNVGGVGLRRYASIFQRKNVDEDGHLNIPVACVTDMDVMPDCAPVIIGKLNVDDIWPELSNNRKWRAKRDFKNDENALADERNKKESKASGQCVKTFVSDEWTLEYDLALGQKDQNGAFSGGLAEDVFVAACLAENDDDINVQKKNVFKVVRSALREFADLKRTSTAKDSCKVEEVIASHVYAKFAKSNGASKPIAAQYLAEILQKKHDKGRLTSDALRAMLPKYLVNAIDYVTSSASSPLAEIDINEEAIDHD